MKQAVYGGVLAFQFLSRLPIPIQVPWNEKTMRWALRSYAFVGIVFGLILSGLALLLLPVLPLPLLALLLLTVWVWLSGGLHLDGLADVADAAGSNGSFETKQRILKDPNTGAYGVIVLLFLFAWKGGLLYALLLEGSAGLLALTLLPALARWQAVILLHAMPPLSSSGLAHMWQSHTTRGDAFIAGWPVVLAFILMFEYVWLVAAGALFLLLLGRWALKKFGGVNGDITGAAIEGGELWGLAIVWIYISFVTV
ncbi:cobalamin-5'-phosphate synthase [Salsuginibacillus halophilus]|uniref:Adenosylcobinamide-GDP ribazoletransferase n=1 Tax=Salsuginibacillus halophilus TaxID=517424 RepID=A0A2P8HL65_9BACI|nr:adenosylcobinamide-GDP ribazoletransferase [Salsuginibacillus halophilus]PSL46920.1 cobalamin-5'-phosphate synthase [Salsuginibacillus halophilus]